MTTHRKLSTTQKNIVFVHQNMPGQFRNLAPAMAAEGHSISFITAGTLDLPGITRVQYKVDKTHRSPESEILAYASRAAKAAIHLQSSRNVTPDLIIGHVSWGEMMFLRDLYPDVPMIGYFEWFHRNPDPFVAFDPVYITHADAQFVFRIKNMPNYVCADTCNVGLTPTWWQHSTFPDTLSTRMKVIHDGIDTINVRRIEQARIQLPDGRTLSAQEEVVTYVGRGLEPIRGFPTAMRAIARLCKTRPNCHFLIVGRDETVYSNPLKAGDSYKQKMLAEVDIDPERVHFLGNVPYTTFLNLLSVSSAHIYLTYPYFLSWSMLEAMAAECLVFGSRTPPVEEVIVDGHNGVLVDFHDHEELAETIAEALDRPDEYRPLRQEARRTILERYDLHSNCLPRQKALIHSLL